MRFLPRSLRSIPHARRRDGRGWRRGSVLILVVALLVLMALMGTAYISTARNDRYTSAQHSKNVQIDMLVEGVVNQVSGALASDLYASDATHTYRPSDTYSVHDKNYDQFDAFSFTTPFDVRGSGQIAGNLAQNVADDGFLSERIPTPLDPGSPFSAANPPIWRGLGYPIQRDSTNLTNTGIFWRFNSPDSKTAFDLTLPFGPNYVNNLNNASGPVPPNFTGKPWFVPTVKEFPTSSGHFYPALQPYAWDPTTQPPKLIPGTPFIGADADGDGVADSGLFKLPVGTIDGVTYYAAVRIVDNNSAINVNTAWTNLEYEGTGGTTLNASGGGYPGRYYTPASIGLAELLRTTNLASPAVGTEGAEIKALFDWRFNGHAPVDGVYVQNIKPSSTAKFDDGNAIPIFQYQTIQEALSETLGLRSSNPGRIAGAPGPGATTDYARGFSITDSMSLAYHFGLLNPEASASPFEAAINTVNNNQDSVYRGVKNFGKKWTNYAASTTGIDNWFQDNFNYDAETVGTPASFMQRRPILTANNPVSQQAPAHEMIDTYVLDAGMQSYLFANGVITPNTVASPTKVSINQAPFQDLWRAFWNVMTERTVAPASGLPFTNQVWRGSPFDLRIAYTAKNSGATYVRAGGNIDVDPPTFNSPYLGSTFDEYNETTPATSYLPTRSTPTYDPTVPMTGAAAPTDYHPARQFRSPMRAPANPTVTTPPFPGFDASTPRLDAHQVMLLRSAIAAVNAEDLRDADDDVTGERILLQPSNGSISGNPASAVHMPAEAVVYGTERQPYITEVFVDTNTELGPRYAAPAPPNPYGYVAIELYNPYNQDIVLKNWKIVAIDRRSDPATGIAGNPPYSRANGTLTRPGATAPNMQYNLVLDQSTLIADFDPLYADGDAAGDVFVDAAATSAVTATAPLVVPARGYLLLENYWDGATYSQGTGTPPVAGIGIAGHRPVATGLPLTGPIIGANSGNDRTDAWAPTHPAARRAGMPRLNVACVPGLSGVADVNWGAAAAPEWATGIRSVFNRELVLLRPRRADGQYAKGLYPPLTLAGNATLPARAYDETPNVIGTATPPSAGEVPYSHLRDMVPVDSFDFTGLQIPQPPAGSGTPASPEPLGRGAVNTTVAEAWHYTRQTVDAANGLPNWKFVYPGRYRTSTGPGNLILGTATASLANDPLPRQQGTQYVGWANDDNTDNPWNGVSATLPIPAGSGPTLGIDPTTGVAAANDSLMASYPTVFRVPLAYYNYSSENVTLSGTPMDIPHNSVGEQPLSVAPAYGTSTVYNRAPYGGFARDGDILATPFIGAYTMRYLDPVTDLGYSGPAGNLGGSLFTIAEMNSVTMDASFAEDTDTHDDPVTALTMGTLDESAAGGNGTREREQLGRFYPIRALINEGGITTPNDLPDYSPAAGYPTPAFTAYTGPGLAVNDYGFDPSYQAANPAVPLPARGCDWEPYWRYHWAADIFEYLTVHAPSDDYLPNYPMQKAWQAGLPALPAAAQPTYYAGDLISFYNGGGGNLGQPQHQIWLVTRTHQITSAMPFPLSDAQANPGSLTLLFTCIPVKNSTDNVAACRGGSYAQQHSEDNVGVEGLININTASWRVLSALPLIVNPRTGLPDDTQVSTVYGGAYGGWTFRQLNAEMAKAIVYYRDIDANEDPNIVQPHGPFRSIMELNRVVDLRTNGPFITAFGRYVPAGLGYPTGANQVLRGFQNGFGLVTPNAVVAGLIEPDDGMGDFSPSNPMGTNVAVGVPDGVRGDYEERMLQLSRISNMITTRSDTFTCYILVQGWRDAETTNARLVVQRRVGYIIDRSRITPATPDELIKQAFVNN